ncbi:MAG: hypothetical protein A2W90_10535 [Bacteroidetes bacterium GWF2_42_66]|nr:MAG: hypothetical protein A2W92_24230 [Bacteroidetes bacterium GWA2_42_15]OFY01473.1 MAG: hypothetical protein A2W89_01980 [Bacteroidetes bacterium GWE2_42_39]OFY43346.1 MAG: hypothetical protein A2W90_10535 [Bacteroidetes bacterium GWF2_42_66]HBL77471.1 hypothetical protein [Prolixibacteraceae bacterium]HCR91303.1 hypothetical protein [Prolixibacteraceae bacterium]
MFLTGFSSPFISIFLAIVLPWLLVFFGKGTARQIILDSKEIFHFQENRIEKPNDSETFSFSKAEKEPTDKRFLVFIETDKTCFLFLNEQPKHTHPVSNVSLISQTVSVSGTRAPPQMFTI